MVRNGSGNGSGSGSNRTDRAAWVEGESRVGKHLSIEEGKDGEGRDRSTHV
jgi:hypothetical protein